MNNIDAAARALANAIWEANPEVEDVWDLLSADERINYRHWAQAVMEAASSSKADAQ